MEATSVCVWVPGAYELPLVCQKLAASGKYDAVLALGCVIRGGTAHFDYVAGESAKGLAGYSPPPRRVPLTTSKGPVDHPERSR